MSDVNIQISNEVVQTIIEKKIQTAVVSALSGETNLLEAMVKTVLMVKVNSEGHVDKYSSRDSVDYLEWLCRRVIREQAEIGVKKFVENNASVIEKEIEKQLKTQTKSLAAQFVTSLLDTSKNAWRIKADVHLNPQ